MDDHSIIEQVRRGHTQAFEALVLCYQLPLFRYLGRMGLASETVEDLVQHSFLRAFQHLPRFDPDRARFSTWLFTIARRLAGNGTGRMSAGGSPGEPGRRLLVSPSEPYHPRKPSMSDTSVSPRRPALAAVLSVLLPGLGQLYNGQLNKGLFLFMGFAFVSVPFLAFVALALPPAWLLPSLLMSLLATLGLYGYGILDAWRVARHSPDYHPRPWQQPAIYVSLALFAYLSVLAGATRYVRAHIVEPFRIPSSSMAPNVLRGDFLFADKRVNRPGCKSRIRHGDIAIFIYPNDRTRYYMKRIVGLPGDRIRIRGRTLWVNGQAVTRPGSSPDQCIERGDSGPYTVLCAPGGGTTELDLTVPSGQVFVLGDNRAKAKDSRDFGTVPLRDVIGRAVQVWFSYTPDGGIRWDRLGKTL